MCDDHDHYVRQVPVVDANEATIDEENELLARLVSQACCSLTSSIRNRNSKYEEKETGNVQHKKCLVTCDKQ